VTLGADVVSLTALKGLERRGDRTGSISIWAVDAILFLRCLAIAPRLTLLRSSVAAGKLFEPLIKACFKLFDAAGDRPDRFNKLFCKARGRFPSPDSHIDLLMPRGSLRKAWRLEKLVRFFGIFFARAPALPRPPPLLLHLLRCAYLY